MASCIVGVELLTAVLDSGRDLRTEFPTCVSACQVSSSQNKGDIRVVLLAHLTHS